MPAVTMQWYGEPAEVSAKLGCYESRVGDRVELTVVGDLDVATKDSLVAAAARLISEGPAHFVLNLNGAPFIDSTGLLGLVKIRSICDEAGCTLRLTQPGPFVSDLLTRTGLSTYLNADRSSVDVSEPKRLND